VRIIKAILSVIDSLGKVKPLKYVVDSSGNPLIPASIEKDSVGLAKDSTLVDIRDRVATEATLSGIKSRIDNLSFDKDRNLYTHDPVAEKNISDLRTDLSKYLGADSSGFPTALRSFFLVAPKASIPSGEVWFVASGRYLATVSLSIAGYLRNEGLVTVRDEMDVDGGELDNVSEVVIGW